MNRFLAVLAGLSCTLALPACSRVRTQAEQYNLWKVRCYELSELFEKKLQFHPYHPMANHDADRCSSTNPDFHWDADKKNMHILVANFFYHYDIEVRRRALDMLESYHCERDNNCRKLARLFDQHISSSLSIQSPEWKTELHQRARDFYRYLLTKQ
ncbi:MAG: hypothetical protein HY074_10910 [Deltaproteobacteria bacterium]|nr:hypothetical protein [Deltaproteobacteria bacterium]